MKNGVYKYKNGRFCERICSRMYNKRNGDFILCKKVINNLRIGETAVQVKDDKIDIIVKNKGGAFPQIPLVPETLELMF